ncbi:uncharacterized protein DUF4304 [Gillisia mitskevichiae]|uniref:Uncharacterized protein DUF4304 n=1 Tax=Gillisia mitskevichiae TaxID=270921 RepID=A0A495NXG7_9FLAO|nr:DUF4304 domain-containing protein [Gillisia mitskevichiae]RKS42567.1 uncharacterized protein DUF4304 [Gillisia mitskevichiae]
MNTAEFRKLITKHFSPKIRELGWKGSGFHYRKVDQNHIVNILGLQGSRFGDSIYCETAIHFDFIPDLVGFSYDKSTYDSCLIRERITPNNSGGWNLSNKEDINIETINSIWTSFKLQGTKFYEDFSKFPHPFDKIKPQDLRNNTNYKILGKYFITNHIELANLLKEINLLIGNKAMAKEFSILGIEAINDLGRKLLVGKKTKSYRETERFIENQLKKLTIE